MNFSIAIMFLMGGLLQVDSKQCSDTAAPTIKIDGNECQDYTVKASTSLGLPVAVKWKPAIQDDCDSKAKFVKSSKSSGDTFDVGTTPVMLTYKYLENTNEVEFSTCTFNVIVSDVIVNDCFDRAAPTIKIDGNECQDYAVKASTSLGSPVAVKWKPAIQDDYDSKAKFFSFSKKSGDTFDVGTTPVMVTYKYIDSTNEIVFSTCTFNVIVSDVIVCFDRAAPTIKIDGNECQDYAVKASTSLGSPVAVKWKPAIQDDYDSKAKIFSFSKKSGDTFDVGTTPVMVTYKYIDSTNEIVFSTCTFNVIVSDVIVSDCSDTAAPTIKIDGNECQDYTVKASTSLGLPVAVKWKPAIQDDCDSKAKFVKSSKSSGDTFDVGTTPVMWTYKYLENTNEVEFATCTFNVIVSDVIVCFDWAAPTIKIDGNECQDYAVKASTSLGSPVAVKWKPAIQDDYDSKAKFFSFSKKSGDTFDVGTTPVMVTYKYIDSTNEIVFSTCTFNVIVSDVIVCFDRAAPTIKIDGNECQDYAVKASTSLGSPVAVKWKPAIQDDYDSKAKIFSFSKKSGDTFDVGTTPVMVTYKYIDSTNEIVFSTCTFNVIVSDVIVCFDRAAPTIKIDGNECQDYAVKASTSLGLPVAVKWKPAIQDDYDSKAKIFSFSKKSGDTFDVGTTPVMVTYKYIDSTNEIVFSTCTFNVIVSDVIVSDCSDTAAPTIKIDGNECQDYTVKASTSLGLPVAVKWKPAIQDDCDSKAKFVKSSKSSGDTFDVGTTPVMWTYKYLENTNEVEFATCTFNVIVSDVIVCFDRAAPTIKIDGNECQDYAVKASTSLGSPVAVKWKPAIQDDYDSKAKFFSFSKKSGDTFDVGTTPVMVTYKYIDSTNEIVFSTCTFNVIVSDGSDTYFNGGDNIAKCDDGTEVSEDECFIAASEVNGNALSEFIVFGPDSEGLPCGCWIYEESSFFRDPTSVENCDFSTEFSENLVCKTPPAEQPSSAPSSVPSTSPPSSIPSEVPSFVPSSAPSAGPSSIPSLTPSGAPSSSPSLDPSGAPSSAPSSIPSEVPSFVPSSAPSAGPSSIPSLTPSGAPSSSPSLDPSGAPSSAPSSIPSEVPSFVPSSAPSAGPSSIPSLTPSGAPSSSPSLDPSGAPSSAPSSIPSEVPSFVPSSAPSAGPSSIPSLTPSGAPSSSPSLDPSGAPSSAPSSIPSEVPSFVPSSAPSAGPSSIPSLTPSGAPSSSPSLDPSGAPSSAPSSIPSEVPSFVPSSAPSAGPSSIPSLTPSGAPSSSPSLDPSCAPSSAPSSSSSALPSLLPSSIPSQKPSQSPSDESSSAPSQDPSSKPSTVPSFKPSSLPNGSPSTGPSSGPSFKPSQSPSVVPSSGPSQDPSSKPSAVTSFTPSSLPSGNPSAGLSSGPSLKHSQSPSDIPSSALNLDPSSKPSAVPSLVPSSAPSFDPSVGPSAITSEVPSAALSFIPSISPSFPPSSTPSLDPSTMPSSVPTMTPSSTFAAIALISQDISLKDAQSGYEEIAAKTAGTKQRRRALQSTNDLEEVETLVETTATATSCDKITEETGVGTVGKQCFTFVTTISAKVSTGVNVQKAVGDIEGAISSGKFASDLETDQGIEATVILPPSEEPSSFPSSSPSTSIEPSLTPSIEPSAIPSLSNAPSTSAVPSTVPSATAEPSVSFTPSSLPSPLPSAVPSFIPSFMPSDAPSSVPSLDPSGAPSFVQSSKPSSLPSPAPTIDCSNDLNFRFKGESSRTCDSYVAFKPVKRCKKEQPGTGKKVRKFCPGTCKKKCKTPSFVPSLKPSSLPSPAPTNDCSNDLDFRFEGDSSRTCDSYVASKPVKRCKKEQPGTGKKVRKFCPGTCKKKCKTPRGDCENLKTFQFQGNQKFTCDLYVAVKPNKRCRKEVQGKRDNVTGKLKRVRFFCPATCKRKCKSL